MPINLCVTSEVRVKEWECLLFVFRANPVVEKLSAFFVLVGLVFLTLAILTFALFNSSSSTPGGPTGRG